MIGHGEFILTLMKLVHHLIDHKSRFVHRHFHSTIENSVRNTCIDVQHLRIGPVCDHILGIVEDKAHGLTGFDVVAVKRGDRLMLIIRRSDRLVTRVRFTGRNICSKLIADRTGNALRIHIGGNTGAEVEFIRNTCADMQLNCLRGIAHAIFHPIAVRPNLHKETGITDADVNFDNAFLCRNKGQAHCIIPCVIISSIGCCTLTDQRDVSFGIDQMADQLCGRIKGDHHGAVIIVNRQHIIAIGVGCAPAACPGAHGNLQLVAAGSDTGIGHGIGAVPIVGHFVLHCAGLPVNTAKSSHTGNKVFFNRYYLAILLPVVIGKDKHNLVVRGDGKISGLSTDSVVINQTGGIRRHIKPPNAFLILSHGQSGPRGIFSGASPPVGITVGPVIGSLAINRGSCCSKGRNRQHGQCHYQTQQNTEPLLCETLHTYFLHFAFISSDIDAC